MFVELALSLMNLAIWCSEYVSRTFGASDGPAGCLVIFCEDELDPGLSAWPGPQCDPFTEVESRGRKRDDKSDDRDRKHD